MRIAMLLTLLALTTIGAAAATQPGNPKALWVIEPGKMNRGEEILAATLQGHTARDKDARIWIKQGGMSGILFEGMKRDGVEIHEVGSVWDLVKQFRSKIDGGIVYKDWTETLSVATSLCGLKRGVAVGESILDKAKAEGLPIIEDARQMTERATLDKYKDQFKRGIVICQASDKGGQLRDFAVANKAFVFRHDKAEFCTEVTRALGPEALVYGWGNDEHQLVKQVSSANGTVVAANWCVNLSVMQNLPCRIKRPADAPIKSEDGVRYVAFVMSDGDNIQVLAGGWVSEKQFWGNPHRGEFPMTWEMSPVLADVAPRVLQHYYDAATPNDSFLCAGSPGYTFPHFQTDRKALAKQTAGFLRRSDMNIVSVLNDNAGSMEDTIPLLELPEVDAVVYKEYSPYDRRKGAILWHKGKPCVSYRFALWEGMLEPEAIAKEVAKMPASPKTDEGSYALINVHAWSYGSIGGPMEAIRRTIDLLPENTRVVTANQVIAMIRGTFAGKHKVDRD